MREQKFSSTFFIFGSKGLIIFLALLNSFVPISIDLYLPALPRMVTFFETTETAVNLTLSLFMLCFALSMLVWGPLSDKLGRKSILFAGLAFYELGSLACVFAESIEMLIMGRVIQAIGCGAVQSVSMAIVKDIFTGRTMENVLVWIQMMTLICPMAAPVLGAFLLQFISWRGLFWILLIGGALGTAFALALKETLKNPTQTSVLRSFSRIIIVLRHRGLRSLLLLFSFTAMPFMAYLGTSAFIYENMFQTSTQTYSYFFALNACFSMLGPILYIRILRELPRMFFLSACFFIIAASGLLLLLFGESGPFIFAILFIPVTVMGSASRPIGTMLVMTQLDTDNGTVVSLMSCSTLFLGSMSMLFCAGWENQVSAVGTVCLGIGGLCFFLWIYINKRVVFRDPK
jgi:DHA1 family bicyclomycin/chloramphenicol resistance-like MFS transporter